MLAMLTTVVLEAESSVVRDMLLVLVVLIRLMMLLGSIDTSQPQSLFYIKWMKLKLGIHA